MTIVAAIVLYLAVGFIWAITFSRKRLDAGFWVFAVVCTFLWPVFFIVRLMNKVSS